MEEKRPSTHPTTAMIIASRKGMQNLKVFETFRFSQTNLAGLAKRSLA